MKKLTIFIISLLVISMVCGVMFNNRESAFAYYEQVKQEREQEKQEKEEALMNIIYLSDKICTINFNSGQPECYVQVQLKYKGETHELIISVDEYATAKEDDEMVRWFITEFWIEEEELPPPEPIEYVAGDRKDREVNVALK